MANIRRGGRADAGCSAPENGIIIESRNGRDSAAPAPARKRRREMASRDETKGAESNRFEEVFMIDGLGSFHLEQITLHNFMDERPQAVLTGLRPPQNFFDLIAVGEAHRRPRRINRQLFDEIARDRRVVLQ
jgi:hypothetical protein